MGYLAAGAMAGVGGEYLKQSDEKRANNYQAIRDKRLAELQRENVKYGHDLDVTENIRSEGVAAEQSEMQRRYDETQSIRESMTESERRNQDRKSEEKMNQARIDAQGPPKGTVGAGSAAFHYEKQPDGTWKYVEDASQPGNATTASNNAAKLMRLRGENGKEGAAVSWDDLTKFYLEDPGVFDISTGVDEYGNPERISKLKPGAPSIIEYINGKVHENYKLDPNDPTNVQRDPARLWEQMTKLPEYKHPGGKQHALQAMKDKGYDWWILVSGVAGDPLDDPRTPSPQKVSSPDAAIGDRGYLEQGTRETADTAADNTEATGGMLSQVETVSQQAIKKPVTNEPQLGQSGITPEKKSILAARKARQAELDAELAAEEARLYKEAKKGSQAAIRALAAFRKKHNR